MKYIKKIIRRFIQFGFYGLIKFSLKRLKDIIFLDFLTFNLVNKSKIIKSPLILISQVQRSGGTLLSQLFDGHDDIYAYPNELTIWTPKWKLRNLSKDFNKLNNDYINFFALKSEYKKESKSKWNKTYDFYFNLKSQKKIFSKYVTNNSNQRSILNAYFTSFFYSWINFKLKHSNKKFITAFIPRVILDQDSLNYFFKNYPDGKIITIVRDPLDWLASARKHDPNSYNDFGNALELWKKSTLSSLNIIKNKKNLGITFYDLVQNTSKTIKYLCKKINIENKFVLSIPTFNSEPILSDSSFKSVEGKIDKKTLNRKSQFKKNDLRKLKLLKKEILDCKRLYKKFYKITKIN